MRFQSERNRQIRGISDADERHRQHVTALILATLKSAAVSETPATLLILGAGNCRDVDLPVLLQHFSSIHLADLDPEALTVAISNAAEVAPAAVSQLVAHAPVDLAWPLLQMEPRMPVPESRSGDSQISDGPQAMDTFLRQLASPALPDDLPKATVVVSLCLLSQLVESLSQVILQHSPEYLKALLALRIGHLRRMLSQCVPGGGALLITDIVSSDTAPELLNLSPPELHPFLRTCLEQKNYFSGCHPDRVLNDLQILAAASRAIGRVHLQDPWIWVLGDRRYAVYAVQILLQPQSTEQSENTAGDLETKQEQQ